MHINVNQFTPAPNMLATAARRWVAGPAEEVARGEYEITGNNAQDVVIDMLRDGYVMVGLDPLGFIRSMQLSFKGRLVEMHDGFASEHVEVLLGALGYGYQRDIKPAG